MNVFVTGGAGYIGSVAVKTLLDAGHEVTVFDNLEWGHRAALDSRAEFVLGDLRNRQEIVDAVGRAQPEAVMHFAAYALVGESMQDPLRYFRNNVTGGIYLAEAMKEASCRRIIFSSTYGQPDRLPITEDTPQRPANPYGESKLMYERILLWLQEREGFEPVFLRYFNASGAVGRLGEDHTPETHLIPCVLKVALGQTEKVQVFGDDFDTPDGTCVRDYIHIEDLIQAHVLALESGETGAFNLGNGDGASVLEVIEACRKVTGHPIPAEVVDRRPGDPARLVAGADKARRVLGWKPRFPDIGTIVEHAWAWHQAHPDGYPD